MTVAPPLILPPTPVLPVPDPTTTTSTTTTTAGGPVVSGCSTAAARLELSDAGAVETVSAPVTEHGGAALFVDGAGTFGADEGTPAGWVLVSTDDAVSVVQLEAGGKVVDQVTPVDGLAALAVPGTGVATDTVVALTASGAAVATQPTTGAVANSGCPGPAGPPTNQGPTTVAPAIDPPAVTAGRPAPGT
jgi:hypothetical protein